MLKTPISHLSLVKRANFKGVVLHARTHARTYQQAKKQTKKFINAYWVDRVAEDKKEITRNKQTNKTTTTKPIKNKSRKARPDIEPCNDFARVVHRQAVEGF